MAQLFCTICIQWVSSTLAKSKD